VDTRNNEVEPCVTKYAAVADKPEFGVTSDKLPPIPASTPENRRSKMYYLISIHLYDEESKKTLYGVHHQVVSPTDYLSDQQKKFVNQKIKTRHV